MYVRHPQLGLIPSWQFDMRADRNPKLNPNVKFPPGMTQQTIQPTGPYWNDNGTMRVGMSAPSSMGNRRGGLMGITLLGVGAGLLGLFAAFRR